MQRDNEAARSADEHRADHEPDGYQTTSSEELCASLLDSILWSAMPSPMVYGTSAVKRSRRTKADLADLDAAILQVCAIDHPMTVRGVFYRVMSAGAVTKTEKSYGAVQRRALELRRRGDLPYEWIVDGTRLQLKDPSWDSVEDALEDAASSYRRALWSDQEDYVEVWSEKDAMSGIIGPITNKWDVPLMVARGFASESLPVDNGADNQQDGQAHHHLPTRRSRPVRVGSVGAHEGSTTSLLPSGVHRVRAARRYAGSDHRSGLADQADQDHGQPQQDIRRRVGGGRCHPYFRRCARHRLGNVCLACICADVSTIRPSSRTSTHMPWRSPAWPRSPSNKAYGRWPTAGRMTAVKTDDRRGVDGQHVDHLQQDRGPAIQDRHLSHLGGVLVPAPWLQWLPAAPRALQHLFPLRDTDEVVAELIGAGLWHHNGDEGFHITTEGFTYSDEVKDR